MPVNLTCPVFLLSVASVVLGSNYCLLLLLALLSANTETRRGAATGVVIAWYTPVSCSSAHKLIFRGDPRAVLIQEFKRVSMASFTLQRACRAV